MKTLLFILMVIGLGLSTNLAAQGYGGYGGRGYGGRGGGYGGSGYGAGRPAGSYGQPRSSSSSNAKNYNNVTVSNFPKLAGLTLNQHMDLSSIVTDEYKSIMKVADQKQELLVKIDHAKNQKDIDKNQKKILKLDDKISQANLKADKKIRAILTNDQYAEFVQRKHEIKFSNMPSFGNGFRQGPKEGLPQQGNSPENRGEQSLN